MPNTAASAAPVRRTRLPYRGVVLDFAILLDHARTIFMPGQKVEGHLVLSLAAPCDVKLLRIRFCGIVQTQVCFFRFSPTICLFPHVHHRNAAVQVRQHLVESKYFHSYHIQGNSHVFGQRRDRRPS